MRTFGTLVFVSSTILNICGEALSHVNCDHRKGLLSEISEVYQMLAVQCLAAVYRCAWQYKISLSARSRDSDFSAQVTQLWAPFWLSKVEELQIGSSTLPPLPLLYGRIEQTQKS